MAKLTQQQIFGSRSSAANLDAKKDNHTITIDLRDFQNKSDGGEIIDGKGLTDLKKKYLEFSEGKMGVQLFLTILQLIQQNQAEHLNADPEQKLFITENPPAFGVGSRVGQIRHSYLVNIFVDSSIALSPNPNEI